MNARIEAVLNNKDAKAEDYFELINLFEYSHMTLQKDGERILSMDINEFEAYPNCFDLREKCCAAQYLVAESDIVSITGKMFKGMDTFFIEADMKDGSKLEVCIYSTNTNEKIEVSENYCETDVYSLKDYLNDKNHKVMMAIIRDSFGLEIKMNSVRNCTLIEETEGSYEMQIDTMTFPLMDDSCNEVFIKEGNTSDTILIRPYGQPFLEISILVVKKSK